MTARAPLRSDPAHWQIEDDAMAEAVLQGLEAVGLIFAEVFLRRIAELHRSDTGVNLALKGLGTLAGRVGMSRLTWMTGTDELGAIRSEGAGSDEAAAAGSAFRRVLNWLLVWNPTDIEAPPALRPASPPPASVILDLDELHAAAIYLDRRARSQGLTGPGSRRRMVRSTTRRRSS
jgi:hypothetical protein